LEIVQLVFDPCHFTWQVKKFAKLRKRQLVFLRPLPPRVAGEEVSPAYV
jgi:hypothetical protein